MSPDDFRAWFGAIEFFEGRDGHYFLSPQGLAVGPYGSQRTAEREAARLAKILKPLDAERARTAVVEFILSGGKT